MRLLQYLYLCCLCIGCLAACKSASHQGETLGDAIQILDSVVIDSVTADFPVGFASLTRKNKQYVAYYNKDRYMTVASRDLGQKQWNYIILPTRVGWDSHNSIAMTMDQDGCLHLSGNMHVDTLLYFITSRPEDISSFERILPLVSLEDELHCTYPSFIKDAKGKLYFSYRKGGSGNGITLINSYNHETRSFERLSSEPMFDGQGEMSAYKSGPRLGPDGSFHVIWLWRDTPGCETNHDLSYARSKDLLHWQSLGDELIPSPISPAEKRFTVDPVPAGGGAINGNFRLFFTPRKQPLIAYLKYDDLGFSQIYLAHVEQGQWLINKVSDWNYRWEFSGPGSITFEIRIGNARVDPEGNIRIAYSHVKEGEGELLIDGSSYELIEARQVLKKAESRYPKALMDPVSELEGMQVRWKNMGDGHDPGNAYYALRWETLGKRRYYEPPDTLLAPSPLTLYLFQKR